MGTVARADGALRAREGGLRRGDGREYRAWSGEKIEFESAMLSLVGHLIDVRSGHVLASFQVGSAANWNLPMDYTAEVMAKKRRKTGTWTSEAREKTTTRVIQTVARRIVAQ